MNKLIFPIALLMLAHCVSTKGFAQQDTMKNIEMRTYYMALLLKGSNRDQDSATAAQIQEAHMANINKMAKDGKLAIAGPFLDDGDLRGIFIFCVDSLEEAKKLAENDPAVKAGRLRIEIHPWLSARGSKLP